MKEHDDVYVIIDIGDKMANKKKKKSEKYSIFTRIVIVILLLAMISMYVVAMVIG